MTSPPPSQSDADAVSDIRSTLQRRLNAFERRPADLRGRRHAAVALTVTVTPADEPGLVMTRRAPRLRAHPGQYAFPGGSLEPGESAVGAALRELDEEVGLRLGEEAWMTTLDDYATRSGFVMTPVVLWAGLVDPSALVPREDEVAEAFVVPLTDIDVDANVYAIPESPRPVINVPFLDAVLHAPSGAIMHQFREVALHGRSTRVFDYEQPVFAWR